MTVEYSAPPLHYATSTVLSYGVYLAQGTRYVTFVTTGAIYYSFLGTSVN